MFVDQPLRNDHAEHGNVIFVVMVFALLLGGLSFGLLLEAKGDLTAVQHHETSMEALQIAEVGLIKAQLEIRSLVDKDADGVGNLMGSYAGGGFEVQAIQDPTNDERWVLTATGTKGHSVRRLEVGIRRRANRNFVEGLYGKEGLDFGGHSWTDAYDSRLGTYASQAVNSDSGGTYADIGGHIGSGRDIVLHGASTLVRGNAVPGWTYSVTGVQNATVTGDTMPRLHPLDLPDPPLSDFQAALASNNNAALVGALGAEAAEAGVATIHSEMLAGLDEAQVDGLANADMLLLDDTQVAALNFSDLVKSEYTSLTDVTQAALAISTVSKFDLIASYEKTMDGALIAIRIEDPVLQAGTGGLTTTMSEIPTATESTSSSSNNGGGKSKDVPSDGGGTPTPAANLVPPGRISYDATTKDLRATAGAEVVLTGGTYFFRNLTTVGNAKIVVRGPSTIYVTGELSLGGGSIVNETGRAEDMQVFVHPYALPPASPPSRSRVKVRGGSGVAAAIYAPGVDTTIGGGDHFYGSLVGREVTVMGNVAFHYDKALGDEGDNKGAMLERLYWRELSIP